ncbi:hypothetical protein [Streptomyces sp. NPDC055036]
MSNSSALPWYVKAVLRVLVPAACLAALYLSIPGEIAMAETAGWSEQYSWAMPVCVSVYALCAAAISNYRRKMQLPGQTTALLGAGVALVLAVSAQAVSHLIAQNYMGTSALLVVLVSAVPPLVVAHMIHMSETPSTMVTAEEQMTALTEEVSSLKGELAEAHAFQAQVLVTKTQEVSKELSTLTEGAGELSSEAEELIKEIESALSEGPRKGPRKAVPEEEIKAAAESLRLKGTRVTGKTLADALGVAESTAYRYKAEVLAA